MKMQEQHKASLWDVLWENAIGGIAIVEKDGTFVRVNPAFCRIVEYTEVELQNMRFSDITVPADAETDQELAADVADGRRRSYDMIKSYVTKTNRVVWVHLRVVPFKVDDEFHYFISQVFEVPVSIVHQMGIDIPANAGGTYRLEKQRPPVRINWKIIRDWLPLVITGLIGGAYVVQQIAQQFPPA